MMRIAPRELGRQIHQLETDWILSLITDVKLDNNAEDVFRPLNNRRLDEWKIHREKLLECTSLQTDPATGKLKKKHIRLVTLVDDLIRRVKLDRWLSDMESVYKSIHQELNDADQCIEPYIKY